VDFIIDPPWGVSSLQLGMSYEQALRVISPWGSPKVSGPYSHTTTVKLLVDYRGLGIVAHLEDGETVSAIELWHFEEEQADVRALLDGVDIFRTPAREVLRQQAALGRTVDDSDPENPVIPNVTLAFTRDTGQEVPRETDGLPVFFTSVLVAGPDYYA
jgi:hypothetical protein